MKINPQTVANVKQLLEVGLPILTAAVLLLTGFLLKFVKDIKDIRAELNHLNVTIIGVVAGSKIPPALAPFPDYVNLKKAKKCNKAICVLHCRTLSYALRHCDFVCADVYKIDEKVHRPNDDFWAALTDGVV